MIFDILPSNREEARSEIHDLLRENCPNGSQSKRDSECRISLSTLYQERIKSVARMFPQALADCDIDGRNALHWASRYDAPELVRFILNSGVNPCESRNSYSLPLAEAAALNYGPVLDLLIQATGVDERGGSVQATALMEASFCGNAPAIAQLLSHGADVSLTTERGDTALHLLCFGKKNESRAIACMSLLIEAGAPLNTQNKIGETPLDIATEGGGPLAEPLRALIERKTLQALELNVKTASKRSL